MSVNEIKEAIIMLEVGQHILSKVKEGIEEPKLSKENKLLLEKYKKHIYNYDKIGMSKKDTEMVEEDLEDEIFHVELFLLWKQEN